MYICICNAIRENELRAAARDCSRDAEEIYIALGRPPQCRQCLDDARQIINEERTARKLPVCTMN